MKVLALIWEDEQAWSSLPEAEQQAVREQYRAVVESAGGRVFDGAELAPTSTATTVRVRDGKLAVTDGPFAETREQLGGYVVFDVADLDEAAALAERLPGAEQGWIELRPASVEEEQ